MNKGKTSFWQSSLWAQILNKTHQAKDIFIVSGENHSFLVERRTLFSRYTALYMLGVDTNLSSDCLSFIRNNIVTSDDLFLQIEPLTKVQSAKCKVQSKAPFKRFIEPVTAILDLKTSEEALLASFAEKGRYNIRLAQKRGVTTRWVKASEACNEE